MSRFKEIKENLDEIRKEIGEQITPQRFAELLKKLGIRVEQSGVYYYAKVKVEEDDGYVRFKETDAGIEIEGYNGPSSTSFSNMEPGEEKEVIGRIESKQEVLRKLHEIITEFLVIKAEG